MADPVAYAAAEIRAAGVPLMQRAAAGLAAELRRLLFGMGALRGPVLVLAGSGSGSLFRTRRFRASKCA